MPIYEYRCPKCNATFEEWLRHADDAATCVCPSCHAEAKRIISHTTFVLKGGGWYATEYGNRKAADAPASCPSDADGACAAKPDSACSAKPEGACAAKPDTACPVKPESAPSPCAAACPKPAAAAS